MSILVNVSQFSCGCARQRRDKFLKTGRPRETTTTNITICLPKGSRTCIAQRLHNQYREQKNVHNHHRKKIFWRTFLASKKNFPGWWWIQKPYKNQENHIHHRNLSSVDPIFSAKKSSALEQGGVCFLFPSNTKCNNWHNEMQHMAYPAEKLVLLQTPRCTPPPEGSNRRVLMSQEGEGLWKEGDGGGTKEGKKDAQNLIEIGPPKKQTN